MNCNLTDTDRENGKRCRGLTCTACNTFFNKRTQTVQPIKPSEIKPKKLPDYVITAFNELIQEKWNGTQATIKFREAAEKISTVSARGDYRMQIGVDNVYKEKYLDVENLYRANGWDVKVDSPAYCESYEGYFVFSKE